MRRSAVLLLLSLAACSHGSSASPDAGAGVDALVADAPSGPDGHIFEESLVYGHSPTELYRIDAMNLDTVDVGPFGPALGAQSMTDIAIDKNGRMIGVTLDKIFEVDPDTGTATFLADFQGTGNLTSLSFVPDPADADAELLVTAGDQGDVYGVNPDDGTTTLLGNYGLADGEQIVSSGDIVSIRGFGTLATVNITADFTDPDYLAWIDPANGWAATPIGTVSTGHDRIFGLGFWGGTIFGFVDNGAGSGGTLVTIDPDDGSSTPATNQAFRWYGAGVTTIAPIIN